MRKRPSDSTSAGPTVTIGDAAIDVDAAIIGHGLGLEPQDVLRLMREGEITGVCEQGLDEDAGHHRLTFFYKGLRLRLIVEDLGLVVRRSSIDFGDRPLPQRLHRSGE